MEPTKSNGVYQFPRNLNLDGPPGQSGHLVILSFSGEGANGSGSKEAARAGDGGGGAAGSQGGGSGADGTSSSVLRLAVSLKAGPPVKVLIRSPDLGVTEYSSEIRATQLAGFKVRCVFLFCVLCSVVLWCLVLVVALCPVLFAHNLLTRIKASRAFGDTPFSNQVCVLHTLHALHSTNPKLHAILGA